MKDTFFFSHDFGARNDPKLQKLTMKLGCEGIGIYWCIIEQLYEQDGILPIEHIETIAYNLHSTKTTVESVVFNFDLFVFDDTNFWSKSVSKRLEKRNSLLLNRSENGKKGGAPKGNRNACKSSTYDSCNNVNQALKQPKTSNCLNKNNQKQAIKGKESKEYNNISSNEDIPKNKFSDDSEIQKREKESDFDFKKIADSYHALCPSFPRIVKLSDARKRKIRIRLEEMGGDVKVLESVFAAMESSKFLRGDNKTGWRATFDWLFENSKNWVKVIEGNYSDKNPGGDKSKNVNDIWEK